MNILVLGGAGFLGSNLVRRCLADPDNRVTVFDSLEPRLRSTMDSLANVMARITFVQADLRNQGALNDCVRGQDVIFNCAAQSSHPISLEDPLYDAEVNCLGNLKLLEAVRLHSPSAVVLFTSSSTVIGRAIGDVIDETHGERPLDIYSADKGVAEKYYYIYHVVHGLKTVVLRFANLYGPYGKGFPDFGFVNYFIHLACQDAPITVYGSGDQTRNVLFVEDAVDVLYGAAFNPDLVGRTLFAVHDEHLTVSEIAQEIVAVFGRGRVVSVEWPDVRKRIEVQRVLISSARLRELTRWRPRYSFAEGLEKTREILEAKIDLGNFTALQKGR